MFERAAIALRPGLSKGCLLPCREIERDEIASHLRHGVMQGGTAQVLYISGMPGTGKTAIVLEVLEQMRSESSDFQLVHINAMRLGSPEQIFREVADQLLSKRISNVDARNHIKQYFSESRRTDPVVVLLIDEVDCLMTANQAVLYKVFDWLGMPNARLVLAAISNTMDLPERLLPRVASRFDIKRVDFEAYNKTQLYEILCTRLKTQSALPAFGDIVLRLCAARIENASGDVRKALQICRRAVEMCLQVPGREPGPIKLADFEAAAQELLFASPVTQAILALSSLTRRFLIAVVLEIREAEEAEAAPLHKVSSRFLKLASVTTVSCDRGGLESSDAGCGDDMIEKADWIRQRLEAMAILAKQPSAVEFQFQLVSLASLHVEELSSALLKVEEDPTLREWLESGSPDSMPSPVYRCID
jgi:origin recognition complex subunit 1